MTSFAADQDAPASVLRTPARGDEANPAIRFEHVSKSFGDATVVDDLSLEVAPNQIFGMIGPSGCGKSTTVRMLVGVLKPNKGTVRVLGREPHAFTTKERAGIGYTPQGFYLYPTLTVQENAKFVAALYGVGWRTRGKRVRETLELLEIWDARKRLARDISGGMQRRLALACALLHHPTLLLVDEPTAGLDPMLREKIWAHLRELRDSGVTVFVTTQYIDEASFCDTIAIMDKGKLAAVGEPDDLRRQAMGGEVLDVEADTLSAEQILCLWEAPGVRNVERTGPASLRLLVEDVSTATPAITETLSDRGANVVAVHAHIPTFDEVFMKIVGDHAP